MLAIETLRQDERLTAIARSSDRSNARAINACNRGVLQRTKASLPSAGRLTTLCWAGVA